MDVRNSIVNSRTFLSSAPGLGDWATTPYVYDSELKYLTLPIEWFSKNNNGAFCARGLGYAPLKIVKLKRIYESKVTRAWDLEKI